MHLELITEEMFQFIQQELGYDKEQVLRCETDDDFWSKLVNELFDIEIEGINSDDTIEPRSQMAADIVDLLTPNQREWEAEHE